MEEPDHHDLLRQSESYRNGFSGNERTSSPGPIKEEESDFKSDLAEITAFFASVDDSEHRSDEDMWHELAGKVRLSDLLHCIAQPLIRISDFSAFLSHFVIVASLLRSSQREC